MKTTKPRAATNDRSQDQRSEASPSRQDGTTYSSKSISGMRTIPAHVPNIGIDVNIPAGVRIRFHHEMYGSSIDGSYSGRRYR